MQVVDKTGIWDGRPGDPKPEHVLAPRPVAPLPGLRGSLLEAGAPTTSCVPQASPGRSLRARPRPLRPWRSHPSAAGAVSLPGGGEPILLVYRPAAVGLPHARLGHVYPTDPVGLADVHLWFTFSLMIAILPCLARLGTEMPRGRLPSEAAPRSPELRSGRASLMGDRGGAPRGRLQPRALGRPAPLRACVGSRGSTGCDRRRRWR